MNPLFHRRSEDEWSRLLELSSQQGVVAAWHDHVEQVAAQLRQGQAPQMLSADDVDALMRADSSLQLEATAGKADAVASAVPAAQVLPADDARFRNWGRTVDKQPAQIFYPTKIAELQRIVRQARDAGKRVRCAGYRHTWSDLYADDGDLLVSLLPENVAAHLPAVHPPIDAANELQGIRIVGEVNEGGVTRGLCRIGAATTNEQFRQWCLSDQGGRWQWTLPLNVIMVEITFGGSNAPICHGAGLRNRTLSDLVSAIEFVNAQGELQTVDDPALLRAASGAFGLLGIVTAVTLKLDAMSYARLVPQKERVALAVPPPANFTPPPEVDMSGITPARLEAAVADFESRCANDYYAEWFWFTAQPQCWINTWNNDGQREDAVDYPSDVDTIAQEAEEYLAGLLTESWVFDWLPQDAQSRMIGSSAMALLPTDEVTTPLIDGLHFRRGIQNMRVLDMEFELPIPERADRPGNPDWGLCRRAWWDAIALVYRLQREQRGLTPMRLALEMRIMGGSDVTLAPQRGNRFGTCSIEVLTTINTNPTEWAAFMQQITDLWSRYTDAQGRPLNLRPHWAKQWQGLTLRGQPIETHLREVAYADAWPAFRQALQTIAQAGGSTLDDLRRRFANPLIERVFGPALGA